MKNKLPEGWKEVEIGEICEVKKGSSITKDKVSEGKIPVIAGGQQPAYYHNVPNRTGETITVSGSGAYAGFVAYFSIPIFASDCSTIQTKSKDVSMRYIYYLLKGRQKVIYDLQRGIAQPHVYPKDLAKIIIPVPELKIQQKIVSTLEKAEKAKEMRKEADELTKDFLKSVFVEMFGDPVSNYKKFPKAKILKGAKFQGGFAFKSEDYRNKGIKLVKITNVHYESITWEDKTYLPQAYENEYKNFLLNDGDIVMAMTRPIIKSLSTVKIVEINPKDIPCLLNQRVGRFIINPKEINNTYLKYFCLTDYFLQQVDKYCSTSLQPNVSSGQIEDIEILYPPITLQEKFASIVKEVEAMKEQQKHSKEQLDNLFNALTQKAFKGELIA